MNKTLSDPSSMSISDLVTFVRDGTDCNIEVGWKWEKISRGNECKTLIIRYNGKIWYYQGHKHKDPYKLRELIYKNIQS